MILNTLFQRRFDPNIVEIVTDYKSLVLSDSIDRTNKSTTDRLNINPVPNPQYNQIADAPDPPIITPSYKPLHQKNEHWGD